MRGRSRAEQKGPLAAPFPLACWSPALPWNLGSRPTLHPPAGIVHSTTLVRGLAWTCTCATRAHPPAHLSEDAPPCIVLGAGGGDAPTHRSVVRYVRSYCLGRVVEERRKVAFSSQVRNTVRWRKRREGVLVLWTCRESGDHSTGRLACASAERGSTWNAFWTWKQ